MGVQQLVPSNDADLFIYTVDPARPFRFNRYFSRAVFTMALLLMIPVLFLTLLAGLFLVLRILGVL